MPVDMSRYPQDWKTISARIRVRDGNRCKFCGVPNYTLHPLTGSKVILTVAHLGTPYPDGRPGNKHDKLDVRDENLAALCQRCHLNYDRDEHRLNTSHTIHYTRHIQRGQLELSL
jgi:hypothetical protein